MVKHLLLAFFVLSLVTACGGNNTAQSPATTACSIVLSGAVSKTLSCTAGMVYDSARNQTVIGIQSSTLQGSIEEATFEMALSGQGTVGTFPFTAASLAAANVYEGGSQYYVASNQPAYGSGSLVLNSFSPAVTVNGGQVDAGSGSATATLVSQAGSDTVMMQINFSIDKNGAATPAPVSNTIATVRALPSQVIQAPKITPLSQGVLPGLASSTPTLPAATPTLPVTTPTRLAPQGDSGGACQFTLKGAVSKTVPCAVHMVYSAKDGVTGLEIISNERINHVPEASLTVMIKGEPKAAPVSYGWGDSEQQAANVYEGGIQAFVAASKDQRGESSIALTSLEVTSTAEDGGKVYAAHGSGKATLIGPSGTVTLEVTF